MSERTRTGLRTSTECKHCGETFAYRRYGQGHKWHYNRNQKFCSKACADAFQTGWGPDKNGYLVSNRTQGGRRVYLAQHRVVMEAYLGRTLGPQETVHHKNGNRADNRIENLELWTGRHCKGQRVQDQVAWAIELLREYPEYVSRSGYRLVSDIPNLHAPLPKCNISEAIQGLSGLCN